VVGEDERIGGTMGVSFERFAGACAVAVGVGGVAYSISFVVLLQAEPRAAEYLTNLFLLVGGILTTAVVTALYRRLRPTEPGLALWAFLLGVAGALGSAIHGAYHLANLLNPPKELDADLPTPTDPRGFLTFGVAALAVLIFSWLIVRGGRLPERLGNLGYVLSALLVIIYVGRLTILDPKNPLLLGAALVAGLVVNPAWYIWLGLEFRRGPAPTSR
jgi:hypothetical protein